MVDWTQGLGVLFALIEFAPRKQTWARSKSIARHFYCNLCQAQHTLISNSVPVVVGPGGEFFITDHHHFAAALYRSFLDFKRPSLHDVLYACVQDDFSNQTVPTFWDTMQENNYVYLQTPRGENITWKELPDFQLLVDNPYRTLSSWVRHSNGYIKCGTKGTKSLPQCAGGQAPFFLEFTWSNFLRPKFPLSDYPELQYPPVLPALPDFIWRTNLQTQAEAMKSILAQAVQFSTSSAAKSLPGYNLSRDKKPPQPIDIDVNGCVATLRVPAQLQLDEEFT